MAIKESKPAKKERTKAPEGETKSQKFSRLASARVTRVIKGIKGLGNLAGSGYEYTPDQVAKIEGLIRDATKSALARFDKTQRASADQVTI